jgi:NitT/TauT family transport system substrate-binding protein
MLLLVGSLLAGAGFTLVVGGCGRQQSSGGQKLKVAYLGLTCEAPIFVAQEKGFFAEEGTDVELVRTDWNGLRQGLDSGSFHANHTLIMYLLQPIAQGLDLRITGGIHTGCLRVLTSKGSSIRSPRDLRGKKIGIPTHRSSPPHMFAARVVAAQGMDPDNPKDVEWKVMAADVLGKSLEDGTVDAIATTDPIGSILIGTGQVKIIADQAEDAPYKDEYCCVVVVNGRLAEQNPAAAAKLTRALLKGARWVETNPTAAANLSVEKKYLASSVQINAQALSKLRYVPGVAKCRESILQAAADMKKAGLLKTQIDAEELTRRAWLDLEGVSDEWIKELKVEKVADGGPAPRLSRAEYAALLRSAEDLMTCCCVK